MNPFISFDCDVQDRVPEIGCLLCPPGLADDDLADVADLWLDLGCGD